MEFVLRLLGLELSVVIGRSSDQLSDESYSLTTTDHSFGFSVDPVFPDLDWGDDEDG